MLRRLAANIVNPTYNVATKSVVRFQITRALESVPQKTCELTGLEDQLKQTEQQHQQFPNYAQQEIDKILHIANNEDLEQLLSYEISEARAKKLLNWKLRNGALKNLQDILQIEGFGLKIADKFCRSLLKGPIIKNAPKTAGRATPFVTPSISTERLQKIQSCVAVRIGVTSVTWARLELSSEENAPCLLTHWQHHEINEKKLHLSDLVQRCFYIDHLIPAADCYLFENPQMAQVNNNPGNADQQNVSIQKAQVTAVLSFALNARNNATEQSSELDENKRAPPCNVFYLRRFLAARLFSHLVGTERVSTEDTLLELMRTYYNVEEQQDFLAEEKDENTNKRLSFRGNVQFPLELRQLFSSAERYHREFLGQALLLNLAFVRLVLLQDANSLASVARGSKKV